MEPETLITVCSNTLEAAKSALADDNETKYSELMKDLNKLLTDELTPPTSTEPEKPTPDSVA